MDSKRRLTDTLSQVFKPQSNSATFAEQFFQKLKQLLKDDLHYLKINVVNSLCLEFFIGCEIIEGLLTQKKESPVDYLFFSIPQKQGFLIQFMPAEQSIHVYRAIQRNTMRKDLWNGPEKESLIVIKSPLLEEYKPRDDNFALLADESTLSVEQVSEAIFTLIIKTS